MAPPVVYSEQTLAEFLHRRLGKLADALDWSVEAGSYTEIVNDAMLALGITDLSLQITPSALQLVRVASIRALWAAVQDGLVSQFDFNVDLQDFSRSQMQAMATTALARAESDCILLGIGPQVETTKLEYDDPYQRRISDRWLFEHAGFDEHEIFE